MKLRDVGEDRLLDQLLPTMEQNSGVVLGAGDDCALVESGKPGLLNLLKTDCLVEGIHFAKNTRPELVGWKAMARPLSDFAAMSGLPRFALVTLIVPATRDVSWVR
ncbi:MAG TPA: AIR synthase related protein, partial [Chthoniobacterales bacterium]